MTDDPADRVPNVPKIPNMPNEPEPPPETWEEAEPNDVPPLEEDGA